MIQLCLKALHVVAVIAFIGGMLAEAILIGVLFPVATLSSAQRAAAAALHRWDRMVTTPALLLVWILGLSMALSGRWFSSAWLPTKLVFVLALSGLHGRQSGMLRRMQGNGHPARARADRLAAPLILLLAAIAAGLAIVKPF